MRIREDKQFGYFMRLTNNFLAKIGFEHYIKEI